MTDKHLNDLPGKQLLVCPIRLITHENLLLVGLSPVIYET